MKKIRVSLALLLSLFMVAFISCKDDDDGTDTPLVEDGVYLSGTATGMTNLDTKFLLQQGREEGANYTTLVRTGMYEKYAFLSAGDINIVSVSGKTKTTYGWGDHGTKTLDGAGDLIVGSIDTGLVVTNGTPFTIAHDGFYHIVYDNTSTTAYVTEITQWGIIGDATDSGWSNQYAMTQKTLTATSCEWEITNLTLRAKGGFKFRYNDGWKTNGVGFVFFTNIGKSDSSNDFMAGGGTFPYPTTGEGAYTVKLSWTFENGFTFTTERTGNVDPLPEYPSALYMIGDGVGGWTWADVDLPMIPVHTHGNLFWKIVWINATGAFKFSPVKDWNGDFGKTGTATDGVYDKGTENIPVPGTAGYYMVVVDLKTNKIAIADPKVYLIGDAINSWTTADATALFTVDNSNEKLTISKQLVASKDIRIYAWHTWFTDWWQSEFIVLSNKIEFRGTGNDQTRVQSSAGTTTINLNFKTGSGSISVAK